MGQSPPLEGFEVDTCGAVHPAPGNWASHLANPSPSPPGEPLAITPGPPTTAGHKKDVNPGGEEDIFLVEAVSRGALEPVSVKTDKKRGVLGWMSSIELVIIADRCSIRSPSR